MGGVYIRNVNLLPLSPNPSKFRCFSLLNTKNVNTKICNSKLAVIHLNKSKKMCFSPSVKNYHLSRVQDFEERERERERERGEMVNFCECQDVAFLCLKLSKLFIQ